MIKALDFYFIVEIDLITNVKITKISKRVNFDFKNGVWFLHGSEVVLKSNETQCRARGEEMFSVAHRRNQALIFKFLITSDFKVS